MIKRKNTETTISNYKRNLWTTPNTTTTWKHKPRHDTSNPTHIQQLQKHFHSRSLSIVCLEPPRVGQFYSDIFSQKACPWVLFLSGKCCSLLSLHNLLNISRERPQGKIMGHFFCVSNLWICFLSVDTCWHNKIFISTWVFWHLLERWAFIIIATSLCEGESRS